MTTYVILQYDNRNTLTKVGVPMNNDRETRIRLMWLYEILLKVADAEHPMSTNMLIERLWQTHTIRLHCVTLTKTWSCCGRRWKEKRKAEERIDDKQKQGAAAQG